MEVIPAEPPANGYDASNPGMQLLIANLTAPASGKVEASVILQPMARSGAAPVEDRLAQVELERWKIAIVN